METSRNISESMASYEGLSDLHHHLSESSAESVKLLNTELREHLVRLKAQLELQRGSVKHVCWQKVLDARAIREQEQQKAAAAITELRLRSDREKTRELSMQKEYLVHKYEGELQKQARHKDAEICKLRIDLESKDCVIRRLISENRRASLRTTFDGHKVRLIDELSDLRNAKRQLEELLEASHSAERVHCDELRKQEESFQGEIGRVRRESQFEIRQLIEQLKSKDKVISQLERELGHPAVVAGPSIMATEVTRTFSPGHNSNKMETPQLSPHEILEGLTRVCQSLHGTKNTSFPDGGEEKEAVENFANLEAEIKGLHDRAQSLALDRQMLLDKVKDFETRNKQLVEKNKRFLEKNIELTTLNRSLKDANQLMQQKHKKMVEEGEQSRHKLCDLARELQCEKGRRLHFECQSQCAEELKKQISEQTTTIASLKQACSEKDRRIELIQHRKKRRRLLRSQEKCAGIKETFYGYDEDENDKSVDSETSLSSVSVSTLSEEDLCDELCHEELERSHRQLLREHLQLERSHALLQAHAQSAQDPQRELQTRSQLQADLFSAQCRVELLEKEIKSLRSSKHSGDSNVDVHALLQERDSLMASKRDLTHKLELLDSECRQLRQELRTTTERAEDLEFRLLELEEAAVQKGEDQEEECLITKKQETVLGQAGLTPDINFTEASVTEESVSMDVERLRRELTTALRGQDVDAQGIMKWLEHLQQTEQKVSGLERMSQELQTKVIHLQKERDNLQDRLLRGAPPSLAAEVERRQNLELKEEITQLTLAMEELHIKNTELQKQLKESETKIVTLRQQVEDLPISSSLRGEERDHSAVVEFNKIDMKRETSQINMTKIETTADEKSSQTDTEAPMFVEVGITLPVLENVFGEKTNLQVDTMPTKLVERVAALEKELQLLQEENAELTEKLATRSDDSSDEDELFKSGSDQRLKDRIKSLERQLQILHAENMRLGDRLVGRLPDDGLDRDELMQRMMELEDVSSDLQERVQAAEGYERQLRDKLRLAEQTINELESSEAQYRDRCDELVRRENETKKQLQALQTTGQELREIILDKDIVEQALREKVEFLEKVEIQSSKRIVELEMIEKSLREQLNTRDSPHKTDSNYIALQEKLQAMELDNQILSDRISELEENEEILRENWRRVADEDSKRAQMLEEKVRIFEVTNRDLREKLREAQDMVVIHTVPAEGSLAEELLATSKRSRMRQQKSSQSSKGSIEEELGEEAPARKVVTLKRQLSALEEEKNSKIANLQERIAQMRENEIKLSETLAEMEMTERELRAKLALYESSEVTVEKMIKYQDKIKELRSSQESLLDQLETMENQEVTLQQSLEETERRLKGKILQLEVEMKGLKQSELKGAGRIRELEKQEHELMEKVTKQGEKENSLYVRISALMDEVKGYQMKVTELENTVAEKEEKCRKVSSLESKLQKIEEAYHEKQVALETNLTVAKNQLMTEQKQHEEAVGVLSGRLAGLEEAVQTKEKEHTQRVFILEGMFAQKEKVLNSKVSSLETMVAEKDALVRTLEKELSEKDTCIARLENELTTVKKEVDEKITHISDLEAELLAKENAVSDRLNKLQDTLYEKEKHITALEEKDSQTACIISKLKDEMEQKNRRIAAFDKELSDKDAQASESISRVESELNAKEKVFSDRTEWLESELKKKEVAVDELKSAQSEHLKQLADLSDQLKEERTSVQTLEESIAANKRERLKMVEDFQEHLKKQESNFADQISTNNAEYRDQLKMQVGALEEQLQSTEGKHHQIVDALKNECESFKKELLEKSQSIERLESTKNQLLSKIEIYKDNELVFLKRLSSFESEFKTVLEEKQQKEKELQDRVLSLETHCSQKDMEVAKLLSDSKENITGIEQEKLLLRQQVELLQTQLSDSERVKEQQCAHITDVESQLTKAKSMIKTLQEKLAKAEEEEQKHAARVDTQLQQEVLLKARVCEVEAQLETQMKSEEEQHADLSNLMKHKDRLKMELQETEKELSESKKLNALLQENISRLSVETDSQHKSVDSLTLALNKLQQQNAEHEKELEREKNHVNELEKEISHLKNQRQKFIEEAQRLENDKINLQKQMTELESRLSELLQNEECLHSKIAAEKKAKTDLDSQLLEESKANVQKITQLQFELNETKLNSSQMETLKEDNAKLLIKIKQLEMTIQEMESNLETSGKNLSAKYTELETEKQMIMNTTGREKEILQSSLQQSQDREKALQQKTTFLETKLAQLHEQHIQMRGKLSLVEKREKELLEQITDIEQTVIIPLETENSELKEEVMSKRREQESLNLQVDKLEDQVRGDAEELEELRKSVNDLAQIRADLQTKLDAASRELSQREKDNENLATKIKDLNANQLHLTKQLEDSCAEVKRLFAATAEKPCSKREVQTEWNVNAQELELKAAKEKLTVLQDAEGKFMERIMMLEEHEQQLIKKLEAFTTQNQVRNTCEKQTDVCDLFSSLGCDLGEVKPCIPGMVDVSVDTSGLQITEENPYDLLEQIKELKASNERLNFDLQDAAAKQPQIKHLSDKVRLLEQAEDKLMERVIELEETEVTLRTQVERLRRKAESANELEEELNALLLQEDEMKEKMDALSLENSTLKDKVEHLENSLAEKRSKSAELSNLQNASQSEIAELAQKLKISETRLKQMCSEYEETLSAIERREEEAKKQLEVQSQCEQDLREKVNVLTEEMNDVCERYKDLEQENSRLKQQHSKTLSELKEAEAQCLHLISKSAEPTIQAVQSQSVSYVPEDSGIFMPVQSLDSQKPPMCSGISAETVLSSASDGAHKQTHGQNEKWFSELESHQTKHSSLFLSAILEPPKSETLSKHVEPILSNVSSSVTNQQPVKVLTLHEALQENASLRTELQQLQEQLAHTSPSPVASTQPTKVHNLEGGLGHTGYRSADVLRLQAEIAALKTQVKELEGELQEAEESVQDVVRTVVRTKSVRTLRQKVEMIKRTVITKESLASTLNQELVELLTSQAEMQEQIAKMMETEKHLRASLKQAEDDLAKQKAAGNTGTTMSPHQRFDGSRGLGSVYSRFRVGGSPLYSHRSSSDQETSNKENEERHQWLKRQVADLQVAKANLERRLQETERRLAFRPRSTNASRDELLFRIDQLQGEQTELKKKVEDLEALNSHYLKEKVELAQEKEALEQKLKDFNPSGKKEDTSLYVGSLREEPLGSSGTYSDEESGAETTMLDKPEDVLHKRIKELEHLEKHLRQQLNELEYDRDQLHEIARKDKATIHEQNVRLRELVLQERNLRTQVTSLEDSERSLYNRCGELEDTVTRHEDRVHELEVHERRLRELVRKLKLDEEVWLSKSGDLTSSVEQLSASETTLRKMVQDLQIENGRFVDRTEFLEARVKELENVEATMIQRLKNFENTEAVLHSRLQQMEKSETAAFSKASELDVINIDLSTRLQQAVEENAVLAQHITQLQGQVHSLDRRLAAASDAEVSLTQHVESLQKSEMVLQKKVREYELKDIDGQARIRELEQMEQILKDKVNQLQRNESRLKGRLVELEAVSSQTQRQQLPQKMEGCQKQILVLQQQLVLSQSQQGQLETSEGALVVKITPAAYKEMQAKMILVEETVQQLEELEKLDSKLSADLMQLQQGKGSCGHEVKIEVLRRRIDSYQNLVQKMKHHLSEGQVPSLWASDPAFGQSPESEDLPARQLQSLESERVLQSVCSLTLHHANVEQTQHDSPEGQGLSQCGDEILQVNASDLSVGKPQGAGKSSSEPEESHWRTVELRQKQRAMAEQRGASAMTASLPGASAPAFAAQEELVIGLSLPSESEQSIKSQNDTDSELSGAPKVMRAATLSALHAHPVTTGTSKVPSGGGVHYSSPPVPKSTWPPTSPKQQHAVFRRDDSFYLPSSAGSVESLDEEDAPPLPASAPPLPASSMLHSSVIPSRSDATSASISVTPSVDEQTFVSKAVLLNTASRKNSGKMGSSGAGEEVQNIRLQTTSSVGLSIRQRIAQIEQQLKESPGGGSKTDDEDSSHAWKTKALETTQQLGAAEKQSKKLKEELPPAVRRREKINRLEKDLEEKQRYFVIIEKWIVDAEEVLKNKNKKNDRDIVQQIQSELKHLKQDLGNAGYKKDDIFTDYAALRSELDQKERELNLKCVENEGLQEEVQRWRSECNSVETMRINALDALHCLEMEVSELQDADVQLKRLKDEYNTLLGQLEQAWKKCEDFNKLQIEKDDLDSALKRTLLELDHQKCDLAKVLKERDEMEPKLLEMQASVQEFVSMKMENASLRSQITSLTERLQARTDKMREVYEENLALHERMAELQSRLEKSMETRHDLDNLCARYDELDLQRKKAVTAVQNLHAKVARLSKKCQEKDELLHRLREQLHSGRGHSSLLEELHHLEVMCAGEEYNRPLSPLDWITGTRLSDTEHLLAERVPPVMSHWPSTSSLGDQQDYTRDAETGDRSQPRRPKSADHVFGRGRSHLGATFGSRPHPVGSAMQGHIGESLYVAVVDYQPGLGASSAHPQLEIPLKEGDHVKVRGLVDRHGYCEAEVKGRVGLVPVSHLYPLAETSFHGMHAQGSHHHYKKTVGESAEQISQMFDELQEPGLLSGYCQPLHSTASQTLTHQKRYSNTKNQMPPEPPTDLRIEQVEGSSLVLAWQPPVLDQYGCSNGTKVVGYRIYLNGRVCQQPHSPRLAHIQVEGIRHDKPQHLAIQTLAASGLLSSRVELVYQGVTTPVSSEPSSEVGTDLSSILNSIHYKMGKKRMVMGLYDYDPEKQSPGDYTACELAFHAGDILFVYGNERPDGFFHGEKNGQRGLVPAYFVQEVVGGSKISQKSSIPDGQSSPRR